MTEEAVQSEAPAAPVAVEEISEPESFNIYSDEPTPVPVGQDVISEPAEPAPQEERQGQQFLNKVKRDKEQRAQEIALKQREQALNKQTELVQQQMSQMETLKTNPNEFLKGQGIDPLDFQRKLAEHALNGGPTSEERLDRTQMELAKLKQAMVQKDQQQQRTQLIQQQETAVKNFVGSIDQFGAQNESRFRLVREQMQPSEIAEGMAALYKQTGQQISIEEAYTRLEAGLKNHEEEFYNNPKNREKFQQYSAAQKSVKGPQATLSSRFKEQPTRTSPEDMTYEQIREHWKGKLFT